MYLLILIVMFIVVVGVILHFAKQNGCSSVRSAGPAMAAGVQVLHISENGVVTQSEVTDPRYQ